MKVKICGITHPDDGLMAASMGADYIGILFSERSKRKVLPTLAKEIVREIRQEGAEPVGVFVDETADQIIALCHQAKINTVQLHGTIAKQALPFLPSDFSVIFAILVQKEGNLTSTQDIPLRALPLYDCENRGSGVPFDWKAFSPPLDKEWILAGGLNPKNVTEAINLLKPTGVDVSSGVEFPHLLRKDPHLVRAFIQAAKVKKEKK